MASPTNPVPPPITVPEWSARKAAGPWRTALLVVAAIAAIAAVACAGGGLALLFVFPRMADQRKKIDWMQNLSQLTEIHRKSRVAGPARETPSGSALFLPWRRDGMSLRRGDEWLLRCPDDPLRGPEMGPELQAAYDAVDPADAPAWMCSYAGRDFGAFPVPKDSTRPEPVAACLHHDDGAVVAFDDASVRFLDRGELGLARGDPIEVGPESSSPMLRKLCYRPGRAGR